MTQGDQLCDTPAHNRAHNDCNNPTAIENTCTGLPIESFTHNIMNYGDCRDQFTLDQSDKVNFVLENIRPNIYDCTDSRCRPVYDTALPLSPQSSNNLTVFTGDVYQYSINLYNSEGSTVLSDVSYYHPVKEGTDVPDSDLPLFINFPVQTSLATGLYGYEIEVSGLCNYAVNTSCSYNDNSCLVQIFEAGLPPEPETQESPKVNKMEISNTLKFTSTDDVCCADLGFSLLDESFNMGQLTLPESIGSDLTVSGSLHVNDDALPYYYGGEYFPESGSHREVHICNASLVDIESQGGFVVGGTSSTSGELHITQNSTLSINSGASGVVNNGSSLVVETGSKLKLNGGELYVKGSSSVMIEDGAELLISSDSHVYLENSGSIIELLGILRLENNSTCTIQHGSNEGGKLIVYSSGQNLIGDVSCELNMNGSSPDVTLLQLQTGADFWPNQGISEINMNNCGVRFASNSRINATSRFYPENVHFNSDGVTSEGIHIWQTNNLLNCIFQNTRIEAYLNSSLLRIDNCIFNQPGSEINVYNRGYNIKNSTFTSSNGVHSSGLSVGSFIRNCTFDQTGSTSTIAVSDDSDVMLRFQENEIMNGHDGVLKTGGEIRAKCNHIHDCSGSAFVGNEYCQVNLSTASFAGYNILENNNVHIELNNAAGLRLKDGYNVIQNAASNTIYGQILGTCSGDCSPFNLDASHNIWDSFSLDPNEPGPPVSEFPDPDDYDLFMVDNACSWVDPMHPGCEVVLSDNFDDIQSNCGEHDDGPKVTQKSATESSGKVTGEQKSNGDPDDPIIETPTFDGLTLTEALESAAANMMFYNENGDDILAIQQFHEILTSGLNKTNLEVRWKMLWGQDHMKAALENQFSESSLIAEDNQSSFDYPVQMYVDVLNELTDSLSTGETYRDQYYLEIDKAQLFRTLGIFNVALELVDNLDDCSLDSLEQAHTNYWLGSLQQDIQFQIQTVNVQSIDSLNITVDSTEFIPPITYVQDEYYFGAMILGPSSIEYSTCEEFKSAEGRIRQTQFSVYPNPSEGNVFIVNDGEEKFVVCVLYNLEGRQVIQELLNLKPGETREMKWRGSISPGVHHLRVMSKTDSWTEKILIK